MSKKQLGTPVMRQFWEMKKNNPDSILLFRMGDFYETFEEDAKTTSNILGIALTKRSNGAAADVPLAGFPYHALDQYLHKLLSNGHRVAICEQVEDPKESKGIVKREVVEIASPGTSISEGYLKDGENNYLASIVFSKNRFGFSILDYSTGEFKGLELSIDDLDQIISQYNIKELVISESQFDTYHHIISKYDLMISKVSNWYLDVKISNDYLKEHFNLITLKGFGIENKNLLIKSAALALDYVNKNYCGKVNHIISYKKINDSDVMILDGYTVKNLEIFKSISSGNNSGTLISSIDKTKTSAGSRLLKKIISRPLTNINKINKRLDRIEELNENLETRDFIIDKLEECSDLERLISKISANKANPRDLISLSSSLEILDLISDYILKDNLRKNSDLVKSRFDLKDIIKNISNSVISDPPANVQKGSFIKDGVDIKLDEYRKLSKNAKDWLVTYQQKIKDETGINKLKVGYNRVFGYYIEVTNTHLDKIPDYFIRKQTLTSAERFFTEELKEYEDKILSAEENIVKIELDIFNSLRDSILLNIENILANSKILAKLDISTSFSKLSEDKKYIRPILLNDKKIEIIGSRHPVIEDLLDFNDEFIPNDIQINIKKNQVSLITGPNMSGKSTYLRQIGIIVILAQSGCYVPCESAKISIIDRLFTRVGASDNLAGGESTFLVEMNETANILNNLTNNSLILLDEIGRGTSTYDGLSIAWAITEYLHNSKKSPITLFATHYHELINLVENLNNAENYSVMVKEDDDNVVFLRKIIKGGTDKSYGIHVAKMSGIPKRVINRANHILSSLSSEEKSIDFDNKEYDEVDKNEDQIKDFLESMKSIDVNNISPIESLILLKQLKDDASEIN
tara:strand:+ start:5067 stop:7655 length:2589 start_codon:yes stop_codon:yes gene_type:complete